VPNNTFHKTFASANGIEVDLGGRGLELHWGVPLITLVL